MSTRIRLRRMGANKRPFYRVVVADQRSPRDGRFIENIGKYHPLEDPSLIEIDEERALHWLRVGAQPSDQVRNLMVKIGIWDTFVAERPSAAGQVRVRSAEARRAQALEEGGRQGRRRGGGGVGSAAEAAEPTRGRRRRDPRRASPAADAVAAPDAAERSAPRTAAPEAADAEAAPRHATDCAEVDASTEE